MNNIKLFENFNRIISINTFDISNQEIINSQKDFFNLISKYAQEDGKKSATLYHSTNEENYKNILKNGFNNNFNFFEIAEPFDNGYGDYIIEINIKNFTDRLYPDPEGFSHINQNEKYIKIMKSIHDLLQTHTTNKDDITLAEKYKDSNIYLNVLYYLWSLGDVSMPWCFITGKIESKYIINHYKIV